MTAFGPGQGSLHRSFGFEVAGGIGQAIIQNHHDVGAESRLNVDCNLRTEEMSAAVQVRLESHAVFADVAQRAQAENLISAAVGQDRPIPSHESMQSAESCDRFVSRPQEKVIGIAKQNLDIEVAQLSGVIDFTVA